MQEVPQSRPVKLEDLFDEIKPIRANYSKVHHTHSNTIEKNQQEFGNRKRIKP
jgi:hypothetical protein